MNARFALTGTAAALLCAAVGYMMYEGSGVAEPAITQPRLGPADAGKAPAPAAAPGQAAQTAAKPADKGPHLVIPQENLSILYIVKCSSCHGRDGKGPVGPSIAGKSYEYNLKKLHEYKRGEVPNTLMLDMLTRTPDKDLEMLSREISSFK